MSATHTAPTVWPAAAEVLCDIARAMGGLNLQHDGDSREDFALFTMWAEEFQAAYEANPDAGETYYEDIDAFTLRMALASGFTQHYR